MQLTACGNYKVRYQDDLTVFPNATGRLFVAGLLLLLSLVPLLRSDYLVYLATLVGIFVIGTLGLNLLTGNTGQISLGHGAFMGVGAYVTGILAGQGLPFWLALPLAGTATAAVGAVFGIPSLRVKGLYLALATLAAQVILQFGFNLYDSGGGGTSYLRVGDPTLFGLSLGSDRAFYYLVLAVTAVFVFAALNLLRSRFGRAFAAIRDNDRAAAAMGVDVFLYKLLAFSISSFYVGVAGGLWAYLSGVVSAERFTLTLSIEYLAMIIVGGMGSVIGSILGAVFITLLPEGLRVGADLLSQAMPGVSNLFIGLRYAVFGLVVVGFLVFEPQGLADRWRVIKSYFNLWPFRY
ncbi:branched-chain amino acid ABC transporter permease [Limnochorda pilosa]|uniref:ABC transporter permease n=1 Tax=Limnochorda pilosa TaxID=1555112 RepID=A0A0K2SIH8_LIMPI|nr:branched-chain amino acid ABC transporter permease [Limnochorda pilosa]BAS26931.1 ABC transporter permease [Limnochorda pilosa]